MFDAETKYGMMGPDGQQPQIAQASSTMLVSAAVNLDNDNPLYVADDDDMSRFVFSLYICSIYSFELGIIIC